MHQDQFTQIEFKTNNVKIYKSSISKIKSFFIAIIQSPTLLGLNNHHFNIRLNKASDNGQVESHSIHSINFSITLVQWGANSLYTKPKEIA